MTQFWRLLVVGLWCSFIAYFPAVRFEGTIELVVFLIVRVSPYWFLVPCPRLCDPWCQFKLSSVLYESSTGLVTYQCLCWIKLYVRIHLYIDYSDKEKNSSENKQFTCTEHYYSHTYIITVLISESTWYRLKQIACTTTDDD